MTKHFIPTHVCLLGLVPNGSAFSALSLGESLFHINWCLKMPFPWGNRPDDTSEHPCPAQ